MLRKACLQADFKLADDGSGSFSGYASTFGTLDRAGEVVVKGAFKKTLDQFLKDGFIAVGHDWDGLPVASITKAYEDEKGLYIECEFHSTPEAQSARTVVKERMERGKSVGLSIGYTVKDAEPSSKGLLLKELELFEVSIVTVPCNPKANATGAKGAALGSYVEESMTIAALQSATSALWWRVEACLFYEEGTRDEKLAKINDCLAEFHALCLKTISALYPEDMPEEEGKALAAAMKAAWPREKQNGPAGAPAALAFEKQLSEALAAVEACTARAGEIAELRAADGRTLSTDRREQLAMAQQKLAELVERTKPQADPAEVQAATLDYIRRKAARRKLVLTES